MFFTSVEYLEQSRQFFTFLELFSFLFLFFTFLELFSFLFLFTYRCGDGDSSPSGTNIEALDVRCPYKGRSAASGGPRFGIRPGGHRDT